MARKSYTSRRDHMQEIKSGDIKPLYYIYGEDDYLKAEAYNSLKSRVLSPEDEDFNFDLFYGKDAKAADVIAAASTMPLMIEYRLVVVKDADSLQKTFWENFLPYIEDPNTSTCLIFLAGELKGLTGKAKKSFEKIGVLAEFRHPYENKIPAYLNKEANKWNKKIDREAINYLIDFVGTDLMSLASEIEKVSFYIGEREKITLDDVEILIGDIKLQNVFQLGEAMGRRDTGEALRIMNKLTTVRGKETVVLNMIARHFRRLTTAKDLIDQGLSKNEVGKALGVHSYFHDNFFRQLDYYSDSELQGVFYHLLNCDRSIKTSKISPKLALEAIILRICTLNL